MDESIRLQALDGAWETLGLSRDPGRLPEAVSVTANEWGFDQLTATLQRYPADIAADLSSWTPCEYIVDGLLVWEGRVREAPRQGGAQPSISLVGEGWQYHLDDDANEDSFIVTNLGEFADARQSLTAALGAGASQLPATGQVASGDAGAITLSWPANTPVANLAMVAVQLDMGPVVRAKRVVVAYDISNTDANSLLIVRGADGDDLGASSLSEDVVSVSNTAFGGPQSGTFATPRRYVSLILQNSGATRNYPAADVWFRIVRILIVTDTAYESGDQSNLTADVVVKRTLGRSTVLLSPDRSQIAAATFKIPSEDFRTNPRTARDVISDINNLHNYRLQIGPDRVPIFQPIATSPVAVINTNDPGVDWRDSSSGSGDNIVNRVIVTGNDGAGRPVRTERYASSLPGVPLLPSGIAFPNPGFEVNTTNWTADVGTLVRTTTAGQFDSGIAGGKITSALLPLVFQAVVHTTFSATFKAGVNYVFQYRIKPPAGLTITNVVEVTGATGILVSGATEIAGGSFVTIAQSFTPSVDVVNPTFTIKLGQHVAAAQDFFIDTFDVLSGQPTLADRRGFTRTQTLAVGSPIDPATADQLATLYLQAHTTTPFKGDCTISNPVAARDPKSGRPIPPQEFTRLTVQPLRFGDLINPDDGGMGRDGIIREANYQNGVATLTIDNSNRSLEALLARMSVVQGG